MADTAMMGDLPVHRHVIAELGLDVTADGDAVTGRATVTPEMCVPGTGALRASVLLTWADIVTGAVAGRAIEPRIPLTLDLEVQVARHAAPGTTIDATATLVRAGRSVVVTECWFRDSADGAPVAFAVASFVPAPGAEHVFPDGFPLPVGLGEGRLARPFAERVGCRAVVPGTVELDRQPDGLNAVGAMQGGLVALAVEEAALGLDGGGRPAASLTVRYLRPVMEGPAVAVAVDAGDARLVRLTDRTTGKLCAHATVRVPTAEESGSAG